MHSTKKARRAIVTYGALFMAIFEHRQQQRPFEWYGNAQIWS
jgi:hypothetical protein